MAEQIVPYNEGATDYPRSPLTTPVTTKKKQRKSAPSLIAALRSTEDFLKRRRALSTARKTLAEIQREEAALPLIGRSAPYGSGVLPGQSGGFGNSVTESLGVTEAGTIGGFSPGILFMAIIGIALFFVFGRK